MRELVERRLALDRTYIDRDGAPKKLHGRSLLLVRNVGHHVMSDIVLDAEGRPVPETIVDAAVTALTSRGLPLEAIHYDKFTDSSHAAH